MSNSYASLRPLGAIPVKNEKGEISMQKVKVHRYVSGRKPKYAENVSSSENDDSGDELELRTKLAMSNSYKDRGPMAFTLNRDYERNVSRRVADSDEQSEDVDDEDDVRMKIQKQKVQDESITDDGEIVLDPRMQRLMNSKRSKYEKGESNERNSRNNSRYLRPLAKPEIIKSKEQDDIDEGDSAETCKYDKDGDIIRPRRHREVIDAEADDNDENEDQNVERRHELLRRRREHEVELQPEVDNDEEDEEEDEESEYEEYSDSEEDIGVPRLKPVFVPKNKRNTIIEKEIEEENRLQRIEAEKRIAAEDRRRETWKLIEEERKREEEEEAKARVQADEEAIIKGIASVLTDDEDEETAFELWKFRELKRIKRDRDEEEEREKELREIERLRNMTEEERQAELEKNPRKVTNQSKKGKYKFMQKYFHRGAFFLDKEEEVFKRDFAQPTLEDHFDKTALPTVMQVKNFGRAGRTKYTHLVDQDTTRHDSAWAAKDNTHAIKFQNQHGGGMKQSFERPGKKK